MNRAFSYSIDTVEIPNILEENFGFKIIRDKKFGVIVEMPYREAIRLSLVHGATYMVSRTGFSLKGRMEVLVHRSVFQDGKYIYVPGLFGRDLECHLREGNSFLSIRKRYPEIFQDPKFIIFRRIRPRESSNIERKVFQELTDFFVEPSHCLLFKVYEEGVNLEPLFEYLCCRKFAEDGYLTENQVPWFQQSFVKKGRLITGGIPDFAAYKAAFISLLKKRFSFCTGMVIQELASLFLGDLGVSTQTNSRSKREGADYELLLGEVKLSRGQRDEAHRQLTRYMQTGLPTAGYSIIYDDVDAPTDRFGSIYLDRDYRLRVSDPTNKRVCDAKMQARDESWLQNYAKFFLLANCTMETIFQFIEDSGISRKGKKQEYYSYDLIEAVVHRPFVDVLSFVEKNMVRDDE